jgi:hypothetical protein
MANCTTESRSPALTPRSLQIGSMQRVVSLKAIALMCSMLICRFAMDFDLQKL